MARGLRLVSRRKRKFPLGIGDTLLSEERFRMLDPRDVVDVFGIVEGSRVLDVGCGPGAFLEALSDRVGEKGMVYAVDIQEPFISMARKLADEKGLKNVSFAVSREDSIPYGSGIVDTAIMVTTLHELEGDSTLREVRRVLRAKGLVGVVEWEKSRTPMGPPVSERMAQEESEELLSMSGFEVEKVFTIGLYHYGISARRA